MLEWLLNGFDMIRTLDNKLLEDFDLEAFCTSGGPFAAINTIEYYHPTMAPLKKLIKLPKDAKILVHDEIRYAKDFHMTGKFWMAVSYDSNAGKPLLPRRDYIYGKFHCDIKSWKYTFLSKKDFENMDFLND